MSHEFKLKFDEIRENNPAKNQQSYPGESNVRNVCFVQPDGKMLFLNYGYLVSGEYLPEEGTIVLHFTSHAITLRGTMLENLYHEFFSQIVKVVNCTQQRYIELNQNSYLISEIQLIEK